MQGSACKHINKREIEVFEDSYCLCVFEEKLFYPSEAF